MLNSLYSPESPTHLDITLKHLCDFPQHPPKPQKKGAGLWPAFLSESFTKQGKYLVPFSSVWWRHCGQTRLILPDTASWDITMLRFGAKKRVYLQGVVYLYDKEYSIRAVWGVGSMGSMQESGRNAQSSSFCTGAAKLQASARSEWRRLTQSEDGVFGPLTSKVTELTLTQATHTVGESQS